MMHRRLFTVLAVVALLCSYATSAAAQEKVSIKVAFAPSLLKTSYDHNPRFVDQDAQGLNKVLTVEARPWERLKLSFSMDIDGRIHQPRLHVQSGPREDRYDSFEGHDSNMEGLVSVRVSETFQLEAIAGYSWMRYKEDYVTGLNVGHSPTHTVIERKFAGPVVGIGSWHEWDRASMDAQFLVYPFITKSVDSVQYFQGLEIRPDIGDEGGIGLSLRVNGSFRVWQDEMEEDSKFMPNALSITAGYEYRQVNSHRLYGTGPTTAVSVSEKTRGHYLTFGFGIGW